MTRSLKTVVLTASRALSSVKAAKEVNRAQPFHGNTHHVQITLASFEVKGNLSGALTDAQVMKQVLAVELSKERLTAANASSVMTDSTAYRT